METDPDIEPTACANCGAVKRGPFCGACGQNNRNYLRSMSLVVGEFIGETLEINSRLAVTIGALFARPGFLSNEFSRNRRASYLSPFRLYLFASLVFFLVISLSVDFERPVRGPPPTADAEHPASVIALRNELDEAGQRKIDEIMARDATLRNVLVRGTEGVPPDVYETLDDIDRYVLNQVVDFLFRPWDVADKFIEYLPVAMFFVLPLYALLLKLLYIRRRRFYSEHLVFGMHIHTLVFVSFTITAAFAALLPEAWMEVFRRLLVLALLGYYFIALKRYYGDGMFMTAFKFGVLLWLYACLLAIAFVGAFVAVLLLI